MSPWKAKMSKRKSSLNTTLSAMLEHAREKQKGKGYAPVEIFLQRTLTEKGAPEEVTWCDTSINSDDVRYLRADLIMELVKNLTEGGGHT
jgi:hypothetical protein